MAGHTAQQIGQGKVVGIYYTLKNRAGEVLDTNRKGGRPLSYLHGAGNILPALERALVGKSKDEAATVELAPVDAYGERDPKALRDVARSAFPAGAELVPGKMFSGRDQRGNPLAVRVEAVNGDVITVDHNHPLAGETLFFEVTIAGVRDATAEEQAHGHPHGPGGHHGHDHAH